MMSFDSLFDLIIRFSVLAFCLLGVSVAILRFLKQPLERIRLIQITLASLFVATAFSSTSWRPSIELPVLPVTETVTATETSIAASHETVPKQAVDVVEMELPPTSLMETTSLDLTDSASLPSVDAIRPVQTKTVSALSWWQVVKQFVVVVFLVVSCIQLALLLLGLWLSNRLVSKATKLVGPVDATVRSEIQQLSGRSDIRVAMSEQIQVPIVVGLFRPTILLPKDVVHSDDPTVLQHSLAHEWQHIQQHDLITWQIINLCQILLWIQPCYWILKHELRVSQDQIADEFAANYTDQHAEYAATLVEFSQKRPQSFVGALAMAESKSNLYRRVEMLLSESFQLSAKSRKRVVLCIVATMLVTGVPIASLRLTQAVASEAITDNEAKVESGNSEQKTQVETAQSEGNSVEHSGHIVDAKTGEPIEGAKVIVTRMKSKDWSEIEVTESTTDADGKYTFTIPPDQLKLPSLYIMFDLRHEDFAPRHCGSYSYSMIKKNLKLGAQPWFTKLKMVPSSTIKGRLVDESGNPVTGAELRVRSSDPAQTDFMLGSYMSTTSDESGNFEFSVTKAGTGSVSIIPREHCMKHVDFGTSRDDLGDIELTAGAPVRGRVRDAEGNPVANVWVNITDNKSQREASYEMKRSSLTNEQGEFETRPLQPGEYLVEVEMKATGALEKKKYANFHDDPTPAMFVRQVVELTEESFDRPLIIQAVPHVYISGQCYDSKGKPRAIHSPSVMGRLNEQIVWVQEGRTDKTGEFKLMVPHGIENARLSFSTNEHSALTVQFSGKPVSPQRHYNYPTIEEDLTDIRVVRYVAPILQVKVVDQDGKLVDDARLNVIYSNVTGNMMGFSPTSFEKQDNGIYRSESLCPGIEFSVAATQGESKSDTKKLMMKEGETDVITLVLQGEVDEANAE